MEHIDRIIGYGIPSRRFNEKFDSLPPEKREILERVARRMQTITKIGYEVIFLNNPNDEKGTNSTIQRWEFSSIKIYLYCTCIDTLAGKPDYLDFYQWLKTQQEINISNENIDAYHEKYLDEFGDRRNFSKLIKHLPPTVKSWLNQNVAIQKSDEYEVATVRSEEEFINHLVDYFYFTWRNPFTHQSVTRPVDFFPDINALDDYYSQIEELSNIANQEWFRQPIDFKLNSGKILWSLWHRKNIDIEMVLKIIIQPAVFQFLEIDITEDLVAKLIHLFHRLHWMYEYIHEIRWNAKYLEAWKEISDINSQDYLSNMQRHGIYRLSLTATNQLLGFFAANNNMENSLREYFQKYIERVNNINNVISEFNQNHQRREKYEPAEEKKVGQEFATFLLGLTKETVYAEIIKHSHQAWDIWLLIRDNSDYESKNWDELFV